MNEKLVISERIEPWVTVGKGWLPLIVKLDEQLAQVDPDYTILQIKEKFGALRYYANSEKFTDSEYNLIYEAEKKTATMCQNCGKPGIIRSYYGWLLCRCDKHHEDTIKAMEWRNH